MSNASDTAGFTVTCPSNSNMDTHPANRGSNYSVKLAKALNFSGRYLNEDVRWQVAMLSAHYTHNFYNFREACTVSVIVDAPSDGEKNHDEDASKYVTEVGRSRFLSPHLGQMGGAVLFSYFARRLAEDAPDAEGPRRFWSLYGTLEIPVKYYSSAVEVQNETLSQFNTLFGPHYKICLQAASNSEGAITFSLANGKPVTMYANTPYFGKVLGLETVEESLPCGGQMVKVHKICMNGIRRPKLESLQALYIYCDVVEPQHVGDTMAPLLAYADVVKSPGARVGHISDPLIYLPVSRTCVESISIRICDENGEDVPFPDDEDVVVRLLFRKVKQHSLF